MAKLVVKEGRTIGAEFKLNSDRMIMGRRSACPIPVLDPKASREHAVITRKDKQFFVLDLSRNGTFLNEEPVSKNGDGPSPLKFGDKIRIGATVLEMVDETKEKIDIEIPGYKIIEKVGQGGMGTVYKAKQLSMDRIVALKVLNPKYSKNKEFVERFIREARAAGRLNHPNVIHVHDVSKANTRHYFSMEFVDGQSVKEMLRMDKFVDPLQTVDIAIQTAKALEFAHENGIVHRDIKPDNLMLTKDGVVKIADLGIAKSFDDTDEAPGSRPNKVMGTPHYMAPEQALGKEIDHRVDIYSLGATVYHMLTGTTPFSGSTAHEVLKAHIQESLPPIQEFSNECPDAMCFIVERMMAKLPEKRYPNMTRLIEDMEKAQQGAGDGIERIEAGDSTIMQAITEEDRKKYKKPHTEDLSTGLQTPVKNMALYAGLAVLFIAVVAVVVMLVSPKGGDETPPDVPPENGQVENGGTGTGGTGTESGGQTPEVPTSNPEADKALADAQQLLEADPTSSGAESLLKVIVTRYPTLPIRDEAEKLLAGITQARETAARNKATQALAEAKKFEAEHRDDGAKMKDMANKFREVEQSARAFATIADEARRRAEDWERRFKDDQDRTISAALKMASDDASGAARQRDFDAARKPLQDFITKYSNAAQRKEAEAKLKSINEEAAQFFADAKTRAERAAKHQLRPIPEGLAAWEGYLKDVKDSTHTKEAEQARTALIGQAKQFAEAELTKAVDAAKTFNFDGAAKIAGQVALRLAGTEWEAQAKQRVQEIEWESKLHEKIVGIINTQAAGSPVPLPFKFTVEKMQMVSGWAIARAQGVHLNLDALPKNSAPGIRKRFDEFSPEEQYKIYRLFLPEPVAEDHKGLAAFCKDRGLAEQAAEHTGKAQ